jgi:hypothetical protein
LQALSGSLALGLFNLDIHTFLVPMILQDRFSYVEEYFDNIGSKQMLQELIRYFDRIASEHGVDNWFYNYTRYYSYV